MTTPTPTPSALTDAQIVDRLATEVMGWKRFRGCWYSEDKEFPTARGRWNPPTDWNHWRQVEEKVMEDEKLWLEFSNSDEILFGVPEHLCFCAQSDGVMGYMTADLPTRCLALLSVLDSLKKND